jgi:hypothetical protein
MDVRNFSIARDLLYVSGALMGIVLGYILSLFRKNISLRLRNQRLTLILFVFSGVLAAFSGAILVSQGDIFFSDSLFIAAGICIPVFALAAYFPRTVAYPLILAGGLLVVWLGYSFLRFPLITEGGSPLVYVHHEGDSTYFIKLSSEPGTRGDRAAVLGDRTGQTGDRAEKIDKIAASAVPMGDRAAAAGFQTSGIQPPLNIEGILIGFHPRYPFIGGTERGLITFIRRDNEILYADPRLENSTLKTRYSWLGSFGIVFRSIGGTIPLDAIPRGANLAVSFAGEALSLRSSWQSPGPVPGTELKK